MADEYDGLQEIIDEALRDMAAEAVGENAAGKMSDFDLKEIEKRAIPGTGSCGGMYTANTMSSAFEALGISRRTGLSRQRARMSWARTTAAAPWALTRPRWGSASGVRRMRVG